MSEGYGRVKLMKGNKMINTEMPAFARELTSSDLVEFVKRKVDYPELTDLGAYAYALSLVWSFSDDKLKEKIVRVIEENNK
jgi:hypothetical protein